MNTVGDSPKKNDWKHLLLQRWIPITLVISLTIYAYYVFVIELCCIFFYPLTNNDSSFCSN